MNKLAIVISTYYRPDDKTKEYLYRCLESIVNQTYTNYKIFLIGDKYEKPDEVIDIINNLSITQIHFENLPEAKERDKYGGNILWSYGGVNAINYGIKLALNEGFDYICHLDHDDWWSNNHLELIKQCIVETNADWICTKSTYNNTTLPNINGIDLYYVFHPRSSSLIHSSVCMNFKKIPLFYRNIYEETGVVGLPADAELWERCRDYIVRNNLQSIYINKLTCYHPEEGYSKINKN